MRRIPAWLSQLLVESSMIVLSILLALWVNAWQERKANERLATQSLVNFLKEIQQNQARLDDAVPYHEGLNTALKQMIESNAVRSQTDLFQMVGLGGVRTPFLLDTAWQTALATGALTHMDYETVSALSLTYTLQARFRETGRSGNPSALFSAELSPSAATAAARSVVLFLDEMTANEQDLRAVYSQAAAVIRQKLEATHPEALDSIATGPDPGGRPPDDSHSP